MIKICVCICEIQSIIPMAETFWLSLSLLFWLLVFQCSIVLLYFVHAEGGFYCFPALMIDETCSMNLFIQKILGVLCSSNIWTEKCCSVELQFCCKAEAHLSAELSAAYISIFAAESSCDGLWNSKRIFPQWWLWKSISSCVGRGKGRGVLTGYV